MPFPWPLFIVTVLVWGAGAVELARVLRRMR